MECVHCTAPGRSPDPLAVIRLPGLGHT
jgi:hypothetical protein